MIDGTSVFADSTDGDGLLDDLRQGAGFDPAGKRCGIIGAGGAGRAAVLALAGAGATEVVVVNRTKAAAWRAVALVPNLARVGRPEELSAMDLVVQATPVAMTGPLPLANGLDLAAPTSFPGRQQGDDTEDPGEARASKDRAGASSAVIAGVDPSRLGDGQLVVDLVYDPTITPFLLAAQRNGATVRNGLGMLVNQAARQLRLFTGREPPLDVMWTVVGGERAAEGPSPPPARPLPGPSPVSSEAGALGPEELAPPERGS